MATTKRFNSSHAAQLRELHSQGASLWDCARELGFSYPTITNQARKLGLDFDKLTQIRKAAEASALKRQQQKANTDAAFDRLYQYVLEEQLAVFAELEERMLHDPDYVFYLKGPGGAEVSQKRDEKHPVPIADMLALSSHKMKVMEQLAKARENTRHESTKERVSSLVERLTEIHGGELTERDMEALSRDTEQEWYDAHVKNGKVDDAASS